MLRKVVIGSAAAAAAVYVSYQLWNAYGQGEEGEEDETVADTVDVVLGDDEEGEVDNTDLSLLDTGGSGGLEGARGDVGTPIVLAESMHRGKDGVELYTLQSPFAAWQSAGSGGGSSGNSHASSSSSSGRDVYGTGQGDAPWLAPLWYCSGLTGSMHTLLSELRVELQAVTSDASCLLASTEDGDLVWCDLCGDPSDKQPGVVSHNAHAGPITSVAVCASNTQVATASADKLVKLWSCTDKKVVKSLKQHRDTVTAVVFGDDGRTVFSGSRDSTVLAWDTRESSEAMRHVNHEGHPLRRVELAREVGDHQGVAVTTLTYDPSTRWLFSGDEEGDVKVWDVAAERETMVACMRGTGQKVTHMRLVYGDDVDEDADDEDGDGNEGKEQTVDTEYTADANVEPSLQLLVSHGDGLIRVWDVHTCVVLSEYQQSSAQESGGCRRFLATVTPDGSQVVGMCAQEPNQPLHVWEADTACELDSVEDDQDLNGYSYGLLSSCDANGRLQDWVYRWDDKEIKLWDCDRRTLSTTRFSSVFAVAQSSDGAEVYAAYKDGTIRVFGANSGSVMEELKAGDEVERVWSLDVLQSDRQGLLLSGSQLHSEKQGYLRLWDARRGQLLAQVAAHGESVNAIVNLEGGRVVTGGSDRKVGVWQLTQTSEGDEGGWTLERVRTLSGHRERVLCVDMYGPTGMVASGAQDRTIRLWNAETGEQVHVLRGHQSRVWSVKFSWDGTQVVSASSDGTVRVWDVKSGHEVQELQAHKDRVYRACLAQRDQTLLTCSQDCSVGVWRRVKKRGVRSGPWELVARLQLENPVYDLAVSHAELQDEKGIRIMCGTRRGGLLALELAKASSF